jgi:hypothetical protein
MVSSVGIVGLDYCGSTLMNNILSGLPGCIGVGESHWIVDRVRNERQSGLCTECFDNPCPVFTEDVYQRLSVEDALEPGDWWRVIAESAKENVIISADKRPRHFDRFGVPDKLLLMVKDPRSHIVSWCRRKFPPVEKSEVQAYHRGEVEEQLSDKQFTQALNFWVRETRKHVDWCVETGKPLVVVPLESIVSDGEGELKSIADWMGVEYNPSALQYWETDLHYIGSNHSVKRMRKDRYFFKTIKRDERWKKVLTDEQANQIMGDERVVELLNRLPPFLFGIEDWYSPHGATD